MLTCAPASAAAMRPSEDVSTLLATAYRLLTLALTSTDSPGPVHVPPSGCMLVCLNETYAPISKRDSSAGGCAGCASAGWAYMGRNRETRMAFVAREKRSIGSSADYQDLRGGPVKS